MNFAKAPFHPSDHLTIETRYSQHPSTDPPKIPVTVEQAKAITQAVTVGVWNNNSKSECIALLQKYYSPNPRAYPPDGVETHGIEEVRRPQIVP